MPPRGSPRIPTSSSSIVGDGVKRADLEARVRERSARQRPLPARISRAERPRRVRSPRPTCFVVSLARGLAGYIVPSKLYGILASGRPYVAAVEEASEVAGDHPEASVGSPGARPATPEDLARQILTLHGDRARGASAGRQRAARRPRLRPPDPGRGLCAAVPGARRDTARGLRAAASRSSAPFDVALAGLGLLGSLPLWALIAAAIKLEDGGPVFYGQERVGRGGRRFRSWKFRSMVADADRRFGALQAREDDPRVTRTGRLLRATAMDELPQLWNILVGDMSFVGPRALRPEEIEVGGDGTPVPLEAIPGYEARHRVTPGLTGLAQIYAAARHLAPRRSSSSTGSTSAGRASGSTSGSSRCRSGLRCAPSGSIGAPRSDPRADSAVARGFGSSSERR